MARTELKSLCRDLKWVYDLENVRITGTRISFAPVYGSFRVGSGYSGDLSWVHETRCESDGHSVSIDGINQVPYYIVRYTIYVSHVYCTYSFPYYQRLVELTHIAPSWSKRNLRVGKFSHSFLRPLSSRTCFSCFVVETAKFQLH
jgi:hypothetical protein